jgi:hypothetical protein
VSSAPRAVSAQTWPTGHIGWIFAGLVQFEARATSFLAEGLRRDERLLFVAEDPKLDTWPATLLNGRVLLVASVSEVYGDDRMVNPARQRATFASMVNEAISEGYGGLRIAADDTSLIVGPERLQAWIEWEEVVGRFIAEQPLTALCSFDRHKTETNVLSQVIRLHQARVEPETVFQATT